MRNIPHPSARALLLFSALGVVGCKDDTAGPGGPAGTPTATTVMAVAASQKTVCAITTEGFLFCAGGGYGRNATLVTPELRFKAIEAFGDRAPSLSSGLCAIATDDRVFCWGSNEDGQLGVGDTRARTSPTAIEGGLRFRSLSGGFSHVCGITLDGATYCWGDNADGSLGNGTTNDSRTPVRVQAPTPFKQVSAGRASSCGLTDAGRIYCWGRNDLGQVGDNRVGTSSNVPVPVVSDATYRELNRRSGLFVCATTVEDKLHCWGNTNPFGGGGVTPTQCPYEGRTHGCYPVPTPMPTTMKVENMIGNAFGGMCGVSGSDIVCWGLNSNYWFGSSFCTGGCIAPNTSQKGYTKVSGTVFTNCGISAAGEAYCWGDNTYGQLTQLASTAPTNRPVKFAITL